MTSILSFSWRRAQDANRHHTNNHVRRPAEMDPWGLGIATSTSSADSLVLPHNHSSGENTHYSTLERVRTISIPTTPEGLRPRKSVYKLRQELLGYQHCHEICSSPSRSDGESMANGSNSSCAPKPPNPRQHGFTTTCPPTSFTCEPTELPHVLQCYRESPQTTLHSSLYMSGNYGYCEKAEVVIEEDDYDDIDSMLASPSSGSGRHREQQQVAISPDLKPGKVKTAVGAVLAAMAEHGSGGDINQRANGGSQHSILPSRDWMDSDDKDFVIEDEDNVFREELIDDDEESSVHASPSSFACGAGKFSSWKERQEQFQQDTSFTRNILSSDPNASWQLGNGTDSKPYDFEPILSEEEEATSLKDSIDAPRVLDLIHDHGGLNVSAISNSHNPRDVISLHSLADTIEDYEDDDEDYNRMNRYQPLIDDSMEPLEDPNDDALLLLKSDNQRRSKEELLLLTLERLFDNVDLLNEASATMKKSSSQCPSPRYNLFLGLKESQLTKIAQEMEGLLTIKWCVESLQEKQETERIALRFCFMVLQKATQASQSRNESKYAPHHQWKTLPGLRTALGLEEDPVSPPTVRGGDSSLFSLPSDSDHANDDTPHTSNVSMATTITTVLSPEKYMIQSRFSNTGLRHSFEVMARLLGRLNEVCLLLLTVGGGVKTADEIKQIYLELLELPVSDLKHILHFFEGHYECPLLASTVRTVSEDYEEKMDKYHGNQYCSSDSLILPPLIKRSSFQSDSDILLSQTGSLTQEVLRIKVVENEEEGLGQEVECDMWTPNTNDMNSYVSLNDDAPSTIASMEDSESSDEEERGPVGDLRRNMGSFDDLRRNNVDLDSVQEEREQSPSEEDFDEDHFQAEVFHGSLRPNGFRRNHVANFASRWNGRAFWKGRVLGLRQRRFSSAE
ncbi:hypothetical protein IV203_008488 [Nitzschia inconspicua]|uniref:Uncharacterized protein n=1 Tax=Nitzschia inconspicua TaxID=303405 RepID=A0A9K3L092_9STRA|nr:hypothetical protein IV203_008488 [Nitzschia inconspicua]